METGIHPILPGQQFLRLKAQIPFALPGLGNDPTLKARVQVICTVVKLDSTSLQMHSLYHSRSAKAEGFRSLLRHRYCLHALIVVHFRRTYMPSFAGS